MSNLLAHDAGGVEYRLIVANNILVNNLSANVSELEGPLKEMISAVKEDERAFYKRIGVGNYAGFLARLKEINISDLNYLLSTGEIVKHYVKHYSFPNIADQDTAIDYLRQLVELNYDKIAIDLEEELTDTAKNISEEALEFIRASFKEGENATRLRFLGKGKQKIGIAKIVFTAKNENINGVVKPQISAQIQDANAPISKQLLSKIISKLGPTNDITYSFPTRASFQQNVEAIVLMATPASWKEAVIYVMKQGGIELNRSYASLVGYLGELRALAILYRFFGSSVAATGGMKDIVTKQQISIDAVVRQGMNYLGFQVKNYTLADGKVTFTGGMSSANFISNRLCLTGTVGDILSDLLATYQFNQPFTDKELVKRFEESWMPVDSYEKNIYTRVEDSVNKLHQLFESRLGNILRVGHDFSVVGQNGLFGRPQMYYNSFFLIGEYYVPSSIILESLLEQLTSGQLQKYANIQYDISNGTEVKFDNYYSNPPTRNKALENQKIHYNVMLDVQSLVKKALAEI